MRVFVAGGMGLTLAWLSTGCSTPAPSGPLQLKVMTYNIRIGAGGGQWGGDPANINLEPVAKLISAHGSDIVGLQEVDQFRKRSGGTDQAEWLGRRLEMNVAFGPAYTVRVPGAPDERYGNALLSWHPIIASMGYALFKPDYSQSHPQYPDYYSEQRGVLYAPVMLADRQVHVFVTHLGLTADQRERQIKQLAEITARYSGPKILMGDFNASPDEPAMALLNEQFQDALGVVGASADARKSFPAGTQPRNAIDYIFVSREFRVLSARVIRDESLASDHNPVIAELELPRR